MTPTDKNTMDSLGQDPRAQRILALAAKAKDADVVRAARGT